MLERALVFALTLTTAAVWSSPAAAAPFGRSQSVWQRSESHHFEIHYLPALARELERVTRSAERVYDRVSGRFNFTLSTKVPLVIVRSVGRPDPRTVVTYATSDQVAPQQPHRSRIVLPLRGGDTKFDAADGPRADPPAGGRNHLAAHSGRRRGAALGARRDRELHGRRLVRRFRHCRN